MYSYDPGRGAAYARFYADYFGLEESLRLFFYDRNGSDCTNFCSQCVWAAYGGWIPGFDEKTAEENKERLKNYTRMAPFVWYGSPSFSGSNKWCRVVEFYDYCLAKKVYGPKATKAYEGSWDNLAPSIVKQGDIIQLVVKSYAPYRYGHCLYVTRSGNSMDSIKICCHSYDRMDAPLSEFSSFPEEYARLRVMRFHSADFAK